ncbi:MAG: hypothetical protein HY211_05015 [Candidatus Omnitrophica bacterium]|nr:hypothetical protein [Candidatus Omnitrophota bacterium]
MESLVQKGIWAPSGDNLQPWKFRIEQDSIHLYLDPSRLMGILDAGWRAPYISAGAVIENIALAASHGGHAASVRCFPQGEDLSSPVATLTLKDSDLPEDSLYPFIESRVTNRKLYTHRPVPEKIVQALSQIGNIPGQTRFFPIRPGPIKRELAPLMGRADQIRFEEETAHREFFKAVRLEKEEMERTRDGLDVRALGLGPMGYPFFRLISKWNRLRFLNTLGLSHSMGLFAQLQVRGSPLLGLLVAEESSPSGYVAGGRVMQRLFLKIAQEGLAVQPMTALLVFIINLQINQAKNFSSRHRAQLTALKKELFQLFDLNDRHGLVMLFRLGYAAPPTCRSLRRPLSDFLIAAKDSS